MTQVHITCHNFDFETSEIFIAMRGDDSPSDGGLEHVRDGLHLFFNSVSNYHDGLKVWHLSARRIEEKTSDLKFFEEIRIFVLEILRVNSQVEFVSYSMGKEGIKYKRNETE